MRNRDVMPMVLLELVVILSNSLLHSLLHNNYMEVDLQL
jgi:hypothetical protein